MPRRLVNALPQPTSVHWHGVRIDNRMDGVAGLRVGIGSGSICSTSVVTRAGAPTLYATSRVADAVEKYGADIPIIADGGMRNPGDIAVAMAVGASCAMMGNVFAGCRESPGRLVAMEGRYYKEYYGMGSERARKKRYAQDRYSQPSKSVNEGVEGWVPYRGPVKDILGEFTGGLQKDGRVRFTLQVALGGRDPVYPDIEQTGHPGRPEHLQGVTTG